MLAVNGGWLSGAGSKERISAMHSPMNAQVAIVATSAMHDMIELYAIRRSCSLWTRSLESTTASEFLIFGRFPLDESRL